MGAIGKGGVALALVLATTLPLAAHEGEMASGVVKERMELMKGMGKAMKALSNSVNAGELGPDAQAAAETLKASVGKIPSLFPEDSNNPPTKALPAVWKDRKGFEAAAAKAEQAVDALAGVVEGGDAFEAMDAFGAAQLTCRECHRTYRQKDD